MMQQRPRWAPALALACLFLAAGSTARAGFVASLTSSVSSSGGVFTYDYTLTVDPTSTLNASQLFINLGHVGTLPTVTFPTVSNSVGWDIGYTAGDTVVSFSSSASTLDITPGQSGTFEFFSTSGPGSVAYEVRSLDANGAPLGDSVGSTLAPVPEPASIALIALGGGLALTLNLKRRRRSPTA